MTALLIAISTSLLVAGAEWLHHRRVTPIRFMLFGRGGRPAPWAGLAPLLRVLACGVLAFGITTLIRIDGTKGAEAGAAKREPDQHLILALDVSPSMTIKDAGPGGNLARNTRASDVMRSVLNRLDTARVRVSVVAFYSSAKSIVVDTADMNVVQNILADLPMSFAFNPDKTNMYSGVREAIRIAKPFAAGSTTLVVISDGDTLPDTELEPLPPSIADAMVLGVGDPFKASPVADTASRQDTASLKQLAARLRGQYFDGNTSHLPSGILGGLAMLTQEPPGGLAQRTVALICTGLGGALLAVLWPLLSWCGMPRPVRRAARAVAAVEARNDLETKVRTTRPLAGASS